MTDGAPGEAATPVFKITEEPSKDAGGKPCTIFYMREHPFRPGRSVQATATTRSGAEWEKARAEAGSARAAALSGAPRRVETDTVVERIPADPDTRRT